MIVDNGFIEDFGDCSASCGNVQQLYCAVHVVRAHHYVYIRGLRANQVFVFLSQTAGNHDLALAALGNARFFPRLQPAKCAVQLFVGVFANATGVQHDDVCVIFALDALHAVLFEQARNALGVVGIHLAPKGAHHIVTSHRCKSLPPRKLAALPMSV